MVARVVLLKREPDMLAFVRDPVDEENPRDEFPKWLLSMCESARFVDTADEPRELADSELPRAEFEFTPGVRLEPRLPAFIEPEREPPLTFGEVAPRPAKAADGLDERFAPFAPFTPPRTELFGFAPPPERPK